ncbi:MAG: GGDEF domain-containing protein [Candidatus Hydrogenedentes bacterium]|nr:GGDEF domain-containing protein [Candidatus Hydrogenedentota bacterium]
MDKNPFDHDTQDPTSGGSDATINIDAATLSAAESGQAKASLIVLAGWEIGKEIEVEASKTILGRGVDCDVCVNAPSVSRQHAQLDLVEEESERYFRVTDLGSSNGTQVNNVRTPGVRLKNGDKVKMGDVLFKFVLQDAIDSQFQQEVHRLIHYDQLTGLLTMEAFRERLIQALRRAMPNTLFTLAMTDLDGLKSVNDSHGHLAGRMVVGTMGKLIRENLRSDDLAGLYGGDESIILFPNTTLEDASVVAEQVRNAIADHAFEHQGTTIRVTISQGLAQFPAHGATPEALIAAADRALYAAKAAGRNCVRIAPTPET